MMNPEMDFLSRTFGDVPEEFVEEVIQFLNNVEVQNPSAFEDEPYTESEEDLGDFDLGADQPQHPARPFVLDTVQIQVGRSWQLANVIGSDSENLLVKWGEGIGQTKRFLINSDEWRMPEEENSD